MAAAVSPPHIYEFVEKTALTAGFRLTGQDFRTFARKMKATHAAQAPLKGGETGCFVPLRTLSPQFWNA